MTFKALQKKPERFRKRIFWISVIIAVMLILFLGIKSLEKSLDKLRIEGRKTIESVQTRNEAVQKELSMPEIKENIRQGFKTIKEILDELGKKDLNYEFYYEPR